MWWVKVFKSLSNLPLQKPRPATVVFLDPLVASVVRDDPRDSMRNSAGEASWEPHRAFFGRQRRRYGKGLSVSSFFFFRRRKNASIVASSPRQALYSTSLAQRETLAFMWQMLMYSVRCCFTHVAPGSDSSLLRLFTITLLTELKSRIQRHAASIYSGLWWLTRLCGAGWDQSNYW